MREITVKKKGPRGVGFEGCYSPGSVMASPNERGGGGQGGGGQNPRARASMGPGPLEPLPLLVTRHAPSGLVDNEWLSC